ncbi:MAG: MarR family transcriptional regulator [Clostridia bacterium]|nr:MarR family transcriptional regulator [Clostridia bacterium]
MERKPIGIAVRCLNNRIGRAISSAAAREFGDSATAVHGWVIRYLYEHRDRNVYQRDLETRFSVRRSTMTSILQLMEKNGLISREPDEKDGRLKKLILTPLALEIEGRMHAEIDRLEAKMCEGLTQDELDAFIATAEKIGRNLDA